MLLKILVVLSTIAVLVINFMSARGMINGRDAGQVSRDFTTEITPAGYAFIIWSLIYLGVIAFSVYQLIGKNISEKVESVRVPYIGLCIANISWVFAWHYELIPLSLLIISTMLGLLAVINVRLMKLEKGWETVFASFPFSLYFGWVTIATVLNATITLVYLGVSVEPATASILGAVLIVIATVIGIVVRIAIDRMHYALAIAWGLTAIGVEQSGDTIVVTAAAFSMMALLFAAFWIFVKDR